MVRSQANQYKKSLVKIFDTLILGAFIFLLFIVIAGGFSLSLLGNEISAHSTENPAFIFILLVIIRKALSPQEGIAQIPIIEQLNTTVEKVKRIFLATNPQILLWCLMGVYIVLMSWVVIARHTAYRSNIFDLGIFDQVIWNIAQGNGAVSSFLGNRHFFGEHFSPILFLIAPLYLIYDDVNVLLILQTLLLASGAFPLYHIAQRNLKSKQLALVFSFMYLCYQPLRNVNQYDFHPIALATSFLLFAFYYVEQKKYISFGLFLALALLCKEEIALIVFMFGIYLTFIQKRKKLGFGLSVLGITLFIVNIFVIIPHYRQGTFGFIHRYSYLGENIPGMIKTLIFHPIYVLKHLFVMEKITYGINVFGPLGFLSFLSPSHLILTFPTFFQNILSDSGVQYSIGFQYTSPLTPFVFVSAIYGLRNVLERQTLREHLRIQHSRTQLIQGISVLFLLLCVLFFGKSPIYHLRQYRVSEHIKVGGALIKFIPSSASVSAQGTLGAHLAHRKYIYQFPDTQKAEYIFLDTTAKKWPLSEEEYYQKLTTLLQESYGVIEAKDNFILLKKGYPTAKNEDLLSRLRK